MTTNRKGLAEPCNRICALVFFILCAVVVQAQESYPVSLTLGWDNPTHNTNGTPITDLTQLNIVCERDGVEFINTFANSLAPGAHQTVKFTITMDGLVTCRHFAVNIEDTYSDQSTPDFSRLYGTPKKPNPPSSLIEE